jgi:hypothetical protein
MYDCVTSAIMQAIESSLKNVKAPIPPKQYSIRYSVKEPKIVTLPPLSRKA